ncbi:hypothetical protein C7450_104102 [Chelatococcus asaccharovorans]|uniref:Uncharacterized protein n=1 Tax=Chelatococcus asaccharovorans TaxID=28210 RepID=A0A2V3U8M5_9HYPH|nr:hypothetical protein C7450_104102 [Chelatococcus asaccharovorans]
MNMASHKKTRWMRRSMCLPLCSWVPGSGLSARPGMTLGSCVKSAQLAENRPLLCPARYAAALRASSA